MMGLNKIYMPIVGGLLVVIVLLGSMFTVDQRQMGVVFQFGEAVRVVKEPGLNFKIPLIQDVRFYDNRILNVTADAKELTAADGKRIIVDSFAKYKIIDPVNFFRTVQSYQGANLRLNKILESAMRKVIGRVNLSTLLTDERSNLMLLIRDQVDAEAKVFGIDIIDARIKRADLPTENSEAIYKRMQTEREKEAKQIRAEGFEEGARIRSKADKESLIIMADARRDAETVKGEGDAEATKIYNNAYSKDPEFYKFYRSLSSYKKSLSEENTSFVVSPQAEYFKYLKIGK